MGLVNNILVPFLCVIFNKIWYICKDLGFHIKTCSLQDLSVNFKIYLKRSEIKVLMTIISKAIDGK